MKQGESNLDIKNNVFKETEEERTWGVQNTAQSHLDRGQREEVCPEAGRVGRPDHAALVGYVLDCSPQTA